MPPDRRGAEHCKTDKPFEAYSTVSMPNSSANPSVAPANSIYPTAACMQPYTTHTGHPAMLPAWKLEPQTVPEKKQPDC